MKVMISNNFIIIMIKRLFGLYTLLSLVGCTEVAIEETIPTTSEEYYAIIEDGTSRTYVDEQIRMRWTVEDHITVFTKNTYNRTFMFTGKTGDNAGGFRQTSVDDPYWFGYDVANSYAVYPHSTDNKLDETDLFLTLNMPAEQTYEENSFGFGANTMVAVSDNNQLIFKNVGSYLRVRLYGNNTSVSSITLTNRGNEAIAGEAKVTPVMNGEPTCVMTGSGKSIRLTCPTPVSISSDANNPTDFWIVVPPVTLASGFTVTVENSDGKTQTYDVNKSFTFERNKYNNMVRELEIEDIPYLTFAADATQTLTMSKAVETLEYSVNGSEWKELGTNTVEFGGNLGNLKIRGKNIYGTSSYGSNTTIYNSPNVQFKNNALVACSGDIRTLIDYENYSTINTSNASFCGLFYGCKTLVSAPQLPIINLAKQCYQGMFSGCNSLKIAPELPAMTLTAQCYESMFNGCSSLTIAPKLPATILAAQCYTSMFSNCKSLTSAPELLVCNLHIDCYAYMFSGCSNLISPPQLPATKLVESCYFGMFSDCTNLTTPPKLPAMTLAKSCYNSMFSGCSNLTSTPELLATTLTDNCYDSMFKNCSNLTTTSKLPAETLANACYQGMFYGCINLTSAPDLLATNLTEHCYASMFKDCRSLSSAPDLPAETLTKACYNSMFSGCSSLMTAPILSAKTLSSETEACYAGMFENCSKLENITMLATQIYDMLCFYNWISGVSSKGTFTKAKEIESLPVGGVIPEGWNVVNYEDL